MWIMPGRHFQSINGILQEYGYRLGANHSWNEDQPVLVFLFNSWSIKKNKLFSVFYGASLGEGVEKAWKFLSEEIHRQGAGEDTANEEGRNENMSCHEEDDAFAAAREIYQTLLQVSVSLREPGQPG